MQHHGHGGQEAEQNAQPVQDHQDGQGHLQLHHRHGEDCLGKASPKTIKSSMLKVS